MIFTRLFTIFAVGMVAIASLFIQPQIAHAATTNPAEFAHVVQAIEELDGMRVELAKTIDPNSEITPKTMKEVCMPVGMKAQQLSKENGWQVKQIAKKYRNPNHAPQSLHETMAIAKFEQDPELLSFAQTNTEGLHYYRRINVESSCLACHGQKNERPAFIKAKYLEDLAYDFKTGDLRGIYAVLIPELQNLQHEQ